MSAYARRSSPRQGLAFLTEYSLLANVVTINRPEVVAQIEEAANKLTDGNKTEAVALAVRRLLEETARAGSLFGAHRGSVRVS
jgi:hypothetical protein